ncbi:MAG: hypothetical protein HQL86_08505 [Magnetococcales bacterium]|nr:hypothetical protein [Magnetococcales bacterium]
MVGSIRRGTAPKIVHVPETYEGEAFTVLEDVRDLIGEDNSPEAVNFRARANALHTLLGDAADRNAVHFFHTEAMKLGREVLNWRGDVFSCLFQ